MIEVGLADSLDGRQVDLQPRTVKCRLIEILRCADEGARPAADGADKCPEISACLRCEEDKNLLGIVRNRDP
jgi:hypothetical protein